VSLALSSPVPGPHGGAEIVTAGSPMGAARTAVVMCHGRGGSARDMLAFADELEAPTTAFVAPQAAGMTWYRYPFMAPLAANEPHLSSALALVGAIVEALAGKGIQPEHQILLGFSQGGCLALEFAGRTARRYGGEANTNRATAGPYELRVYKAGDTSDRYRIRSQRFFSRCSTQLSDGLGRLETLGNHWRQRRNLKRHRSKE